MPFFAAERCQTAGERSLESHRQLDCRPGLRSDQPQLSAQISDEQLYLAAAEADAEELTDQVGKLMGFIQYHRIDARQQITEPVLLERQIRQQQVVIDHDDVGLQRNAACLEHMAV